jgi:hypothetical protein
LPKLNIWIARMIQPGRSKTNSWFAIGMNKRVQGKLFFRGSIIWAEI